MKQLLYFLLIAGCFSCWSCGDTASDKVDEPIISDSHLSPEDRYKELFQMVQLTGVFDSDKTFSDCKPQKSSKEIMDAFLQQRDLPDFNIKQFVHTYFTLQKKQKTKVGKDTTTTLSEHLQSLWPLLTHYADTISNNSLVNLPKPHIYKTPDLPGEINYWDSYFIILGLDKSKQWKLIEQMCDNFAQLIEVHGFVPNGNRTYQHSRSQPPVFALMVDLLAKASGNSYLEKYLPALKKEYAFWMDGLVGIRTTAPAHRRLVRMPDGSLLNRYWDDKALPRPEAYTADVALARDLEKTDTITYRHLRAATESGWLFSSRWFRDEQYLASIHTTDIIPVDLNALLFQLEITLAAAYEVVGDEENAMLVKQKSNNRKNALQHYCWNSSTRYYFDYDWVLQRQTAVYSLAGIFPLFVSLSDTSQALAVAQIIEKDFLQQGGLLTTLQETGQPWDAPYGCAPLQWTTIKGLRNYGLEILADTISQRWVDLNVKVFEETGKFAERYNVMEGNLAGHGFKSTVGYGWTNGVLLQLLEKE